MIGYLYRYPHPTQLNKFVYVGQGPNRDKAHRYGKTSFGRRFKALFPNISLPVPVKEIVDVENQSHLNDLETIWMFRFHTWHGYDGGMNLVVPGIDFRNEAVKKGQIKGGQSNVINKTGICGRSKEKMSFDGRIAGLASAKSKPLTTEKLSEMGKIGGQRVVELGLFKKVNHYRWHSNRDIKKKGCEFCEGH